MPKISDQSTVEALAREFCSNNRVQTKAMLAVGYTKASAKSRCGIVFKDGRVQAAIARIDDKDKKRLDEKRLDLSRDKQEEKLQVVYKLAKKNKNYAVMVSAIREQNEMRGYHRDKAPNEERQAKMLARMTDEQKRRELHFEEMRCNEESSGKVVKIG